MKRVAWVTGAGKGIGAVIAREFGKRGIQVAVSARTEKDIENIAQEIRAEGGEAFAVTCDVTQPDAVANAVAQIQAKFGAITILVNNAGVGGSHKFLGHDDALWHKIIATNLDSVYYVTKAVAPLMVAENWGRIVNIASISSKVGSKYTAAYTASKHGVLGLTRALAVEFISNNITVNAICPAYVDTSMTDGTIANMTQRTKMSEADARAYLEKLSPQNRLIIPEEVAHVALMLIDENARGITGQAINVDGGMVMF
ncbi:MAG: SDR family oxidoreductase [Chloroflexota bacterium]|nr:MAG: SDR family oxidoreductase [Chloroflexota bacterium]